MQGGPRAEEGHVKTEAEIGVMWPQDKEHLAPPKAGRGRKDSSLESSERTWLFRHLYLGLLASKTVTIKFHCFNASVCGTLLWQP